MFIDTQIQRNALQLHKRNSMLESSAGIWNIFCIFHHPVAFCVLFFFLIFYHVTCERYQNRIMAALSSLPASRWISLFLKFRRQMKFSPPFQKFQIIFRYKWSKLKALKTPLSSLALHICISSNAWNFHPCHKIFIYLIMTFSAFMHNSNIPISLAKQHHK